MIYAVLVVVFLVAVVAFKSVHLIGPVQVGLVNMFDKWHFRFG